MRETAHDTRPTFPHTCDTHAGDHCRLRSSRGPSQTAATPHTAPLPRPAAAWEPRSRPSTAEPLIAVRDGELAAAPATRRRRVRVGNIAAADRGRRRWPRRALARPLSRRARHGAGSRGQPANTSGGGVCWAGRGADRARARRAGGRARGEAALAHLRGEAPLVVEVVARRSDPGTRVAHAGSEPCIVSGSGAAFEHRERTFLLDQGLEEDVDRRKTATGRASRHESPAGGWCTHRSWS